MELGKSKRKWMMTGTLAASLLISASLPIHAQLDTSWKGAQITNVEKVLSNLSEEQRRALNQLDAGPSFTVDPKINTKSSEPVSIIVEFAQAPAKVDVKKEEAKGNKISLSKAKEKVEKSHQEFKDFIKKKKAARSATSYDPSKIQIKREYKDAFNGVSMTIPGTAIEELLHSGTVKRIWSNETVQLELPPESKSIQPRMADSIPQIGVDKLHDEHIEGKGIKVGVIDTGIDYNHPDLTGAYKGYRAEAGVDPKTVNPDSVKGWDFVNNDADPMETTYQDWKNSKQPEYNYLNEAYYTSHGTHVSGTVAAQKKNNVDYAVEGIAPESDLYVYRVLGPYGAGTTDNVLAGIDKAVKDGMNVINLSLGANVNDPLYPTSIAINNAMLSGVVSVVAAGNAGPGDKTVGSPGTSALGITVGASDAAITIPAFTANVGDKNFDSMKLLGKNFSDDLSTLEGKSLPLVFVGLGKQADFQGKDVKDKVALIQRGDITFDEKIQNAKNAGAKAVIIYNNVDGEIPVYIGENTKYIPTFQLTQAEGESIKDATNASITFTKLLKTKTEGDSLADFSSRGPVEGNDDIKPDIVAPGVSIFSTYPEYMNSPEDGIDYSSAYARLQGTSMATPHIAGVAALILEEHPDYDPFEVKTALMNTAVSLKKDYSVYEVGSGRVDAYDAVHSTVIAEVKDKTQNIGDNGEYVDIDDETGSITFGRHYFDGQAIKDSRKIAIENKGTSAKTYQTEVDIHTAREGVQDGVKNNIQIDVPKSITVDAGKTEEITAQITVPESAEKGRYEGYIHLVNGTETLSIPFAIRVTDKGIDYAELTPPSATNDTTYHQYYSPGAAMFFKLKSPLQYLDLVVKDPKTGKALGVTGSFNASNTKPDREYIIPFAFRGFIYPFTGDPKNPISDAPVYLPEQEYTLEAIGQDADGKVYTVSNVAIVDNTPPKADLDIKPGVVEIDDSMLTDEDGYHALWVHGKVTDSTVDLLKSKGLNYDQSSNTVAYYENGLPFIMGFLPVKENGDVKFGVLPEEYAAKPYQLRLFSWDMATAAEYFTSPSYVFMKKGTEYATNHYDKDRVQLGDEITMTLDVNNVKNFVSGEFEITAGYGKEGPFQLENVKVNKEFQKLADEKGVKINVNDPEVKDNIAKVGASLSKDGFTGLDGDFPFLDVTYKVVDDNNAGPYAQLQLNEFTYMKANQTTPTTIPAYSLKSFQFYSSHSMIEGYVRPEAFMTPSGFLDTNKYDISKLGIKVYAKGKDGKTYPGTIDERGLFNIKGIPATQDYYTVYVETAGHTTSTDKVMLSKQKNGQWHGIYSRVVVTDSLAGDVNHDEMVDIQDLLQIVNHYGKQNASIKGLDMNQDGIVDEKEVRFIETNFLQVGSNAKPDVKPKDHIGNKGLEDLLKQIGLKPMNK